MDISIIIPVYNVEKYLERCLDSIFSQNFRGTYEVIAVDDCSTDNSLMLLYEYKKKEDKLQVITHNINRKLSIARSTGMSAAKGNYIMNVDSDDYLVPGALNRLYSNIIKTNADIYVFNYYHKNAEDKYVKCNKIKGNIITKDKMKVHPFFYSTCFNKVIKRTITDHLLYSLNSINNAEDLIYSTEILLKANTICLLPEYYYVYCYNKTSIVHKTKIEQILNNRIKILDILHEIYIVYPNSKTIIRKILRILEKDTYNDFMVYHIKSNKEYIDIKAYIDAFSKYKIKYNVGTKLIRANTNVYYCVYKVIMCYGIRRVLANIKAIYETNKSLYSMKGI